MLRIIALAFASVANDAAPSLAYCDMAFATGRTPAITLGVTTLLADSIHLLDGKRIGLITNHTAVDEFGCTTAFRIRRHVHTARLVALFAPEHGIGGTLRDGERVPTTIDNATGVLVHSLYGTTRGVPTPAMLRDIDVLVYDIQDVGARAYTYPWTMTRAAEAAHRAGKKFIVLDRPNPIRADRIEGGMIEPRWRSFTGLHNVPVRYGLTPGELARYLVATGRIRADVTVVPMKNYRRSMWWHDTGLAWVNPSPNIRDLETAILYPGTVFFEATNLSVGRGTDAPLKLVGAPWLDARGLARALNGLRLPGVNFEATMRTIAGPYPYEGRTIPMLRITVIDRETIEPVEVAAHVLRAIHLRHRIHFRWRENGIERLSGSRALRNAVERGGIERLLLQWDAESAAFERAVEPYRLYPR